MKKLSKIEALQIQANIEKMLAEAKLARVRSTTEVARAFIYGVATTAATIAGLGFVLT